MLTLPSDKFRSSLLRFADASGVDKFLSADELAAGLDQLEGALPQLVADIRAAERRAVPLGPAVLDAHSFPHLHRVHATLRDLWLMEVPTEILPWARRFVAAGPPPFTGILRRATFAAALNGAKPDWVALARLALFEGLCLNQRIVLRISGDYLERHGGTATDVEMVAGHELQAFLEDSDLLEELKDFDDPWEPMVKATLASLQQHAARLADEVRLVSEKIQAHLDTRFQLLCALEDFDAAEAVLLRNYFHDALGEERVTVEQLQTRHPVLLAEVTRSALDKRLERLKARGGEILSPRRDRKVTLVDVFIEPLVGSLPRVAETR